MMRFYCGVLRLSHVWHTFLLERFAFGSRLLFAAERQTGRLAISCVSIPPGRDRHSCVLAALARLSAFVGSLRVGRLFAAISTGRPGTRGTGLAARRLCTFAQPHWPCNAFRREYAGAKCGSRTAAAPDCAKESKVEAALRPLWTLFMWVARGCVLRGEHSADSRAASQK